eukprot:scaffold2167_cov363-Pavlova_lutheri.AAC.10
MGVVIYAKLLALLEWTTLNYPRAYDEVTRNHRKFLSLPPLPFEARKASPSSSKFEWLCIRSSNPPSSLKSPNVRALKALF